MKDEKTSSDILKIDEAARYLGVTRRWIYRRIWSGELPASKVGGFYFIRRQELETLLEQGRLAGASQVKGDTGPLTLKCGYCFRLLETDALVGEVCAAQDCEQVICSQCWAEGNHYCIQHVPERETLWQAALEKYRAGGFPVLVKANQARLREVNFIQRLQARLAAIDTLRHPLSDELLTVPNWDALLEESDERSEIMRLLNKLVLESNWSAQVPLNVRLRYQVAPSSKQKTFPVTILAQVLSHSRPMLQTGFDTQPFGVDELSALLLQLGEQAQKEQTFTILMLAATTGWDDAARQLLRGDKPGTAFAHRWLLVYLNDLEQREIVYNRLDTRARGYAELFNALLPDEDVDEALDAVEKEMGVYESLTLAQAIQALPYPQKTLEKAFARLAATGRYALTEVPGLGQAIVRT